MVHYQTYLQLEKILNAQKLRSEDRLPSPAHDETLFIIIHQVYELWFKQIIHELQAVLDMFNAKKIDEQNIAQAVDHLKRIIEIQKLLIQQVNVLETMTSLDFLEFRHLLFPASGFQSYQFRLIEGMLGLKQHQRLTYGNVHYQDFFTSEQKNKLNQVEKGGSLLESVSQWLERTPFLAFKGFHFLDRYMEAVKRMFEQQQQAITENPMMSQQEKDNRLQMVEQNRDYFHQVLDPDKHQKLIDEGHMKLSFKATLAALLINLYQDEPILQMPFNLINCLTDIDQHFTTWRYRHAQMTMGMLGKKPGTGGSSGHTYLRSTVSRHRVFQDFDNIATLLIPRSELPELPDHIKKELGFYFTEQD